MNNEPRQKLRELIVEYGRSLCDDPRRCEALLKDYCGQYKREIFALISAQKNRVADDLLKASSNMPYSIILGRLKKRLEDDLGLASDVAQWAVESWALALNIAGSVINKKEIDSKLNASSEKAIKSNSGFETLSPQIQPKATGIIDQRFILLADQLKAKYGGWSNESIVKILIDNGCPERTAKALVGFKESVKPQITLKRLNPLPQFDMPPQQDFVLLANQLKAKYGGWSNESIVKTLMDNGCPEQTAKILAGITQSIPKKADLPLQSRVKSEPNFELLANQLKAKYGGWSNESIVKTLMDNGCPEQTAKILAGIAPKPDTRKPQISSVKVNIPTENEISLPKKIDSWFKRFFM